MIVSMFSHFMTCKYRQILINLRYRSLMINRWSNNFANLGSLNSTVAGKYLLRYSYGKGAPGFEPSTDDSKYLRFINYPTPYGLILPRILLRDHLTDLTIVHTIQDRIRVKQVSRSEPQMAPPLTSPMLGADVLTPLALTSPGALDSNGIQTLLNIVARFSPFNFPADPADVSRVAATLRLAGLSHGSYTKPGDVDYDLVNKMINDFLLASTKEIEHFTNGWFDFPSQSSGNFHKNILVRSIIAFTGYLQLVHEVAIYPEWAGSGIGGLSLTDDESYILTFPSGKPPVNGFWSLTAYNNLSYLISNSLDRYSLGDRSDLTYPDGKKVYGRNSKDDAFSILIQPGDVRPPGNWTDNWLPAPEGGGNFSVNCKSHTYSVQLDPQVPYAKRSSFCVIVRFYGPTDPLYAGGTYVYPIVTKQAAITSRGQDRLLEL